jgi:hypothetical protein
MAMSESQRLTTARSAAVFNAAARCASIWSALARRCGCRDGGHGTDSHPLKGRSAFSGRSQFKKQITR